MGQKIGSTRAIMECWKHSTCVWKAPPIAKPMKMHVAPYVTRNPQALVGGEYTMHPLVGGDHTMQPLVGGEHTMQPLVGGKCLPQETDETKPNQLEQTNQRDHLITVIKNIEHRVNRTKKHRLYHLLNIGSLITPCKVK